MIDGVAGNPFTAGTIPPTSYRTGHKEKVIRLSRERYSRHLPVVEDKIARWLGAGQHQQNVVLKVDKLVED